MHNWIIQITSAGRRLLAIFALLGCTASAALSAEPLPQPEGPVLLTITGHIAVTNQGESAVFDRAMLENLGMTEIGTRTIWTRGKHVFAGPPLAAVMARVGATGSVVEATALNDYISRIPLSDVDEDVPILAIEMDGQEMPVRRKGPIWIIYPYDDGPQYRSDAIFARSVWQLRALHVIE